MRKFGRKITKKQIGKINKLNFFVPERLTAVFGAFGNYMNFMRFDEKVIGINVLTFRVNRDKIQLII